MKKAFASKNRLFANRDVAIIATNTADVIELDVPDETELIESEIHIDESTASRTVVLELYDFDHTDIINYIPMINFSVYAGSSVNYGTNFDHKDKTQHVNWEWEDLSAELREKIEMKVDDALL